MKLKNIIFLAILIRLLIMPFFFHPDLKDHHQRSSFLRTRGVYNIYDFLRQDEYSKEHNLDFSYPPLTYFTLGSYQFLISPLLGPDFLKWVYDYSDYRYTTPYIFRYLLLLKIPYLICELLIGVLIYKIIKDQKAKNTALLFWFFNPINLYAIYAIGQFDIIPTLLTVLSFYLFEKEKSILSGLSLGAGIAYKSFPLILLPLFWLTNKSFWDKIIISATSLSLYLLTILPYINSKYFQQDVLFSGLSTRIFELKLNLGPLHLSIFIILFGLFLFYSFLKKESNLYKNTLISLLLVFSVTKFHPQWIIWLMPFLTIVFAKRLINLKYLIPFFLAYFCYFLFFGDSFLVTGLLSPISTIFLEIPTFTQIIPSNLANLIRPTTQVLFALSAILIILMVSLKKELKWQNI